jgi:iron complex outermembrane receptor protein
MYVPSVKYSSNVSFTLYHTTVYLGAILVGERFTNTDNSEYLPSYYLINGGISHELRVRHTTGILFLKLNNFSNTAYETIVWRPMPPRNYEAGFQIQL